MLVFGEKTIEPASRSVVLLVACTIVIAGCGGATIVSPNRSMRLADAAIDTPTHGPLQMCTANRAYFADRDGVAIYLTGSHTWNSLQDWGNSNPPPVMDY